MPNSLTMICPGFVLVRRMLAMKSIIMFAGLALGSAVMQQAVACDWNQLHANNAPATVVVCDNGGCRAVEVGNHLNMQPHRSRQHQLLPPSRPIRRQLP